MDDWWGTATTWFSDVGNWASGLFGSSNGGNTFIDKAAGVLQQEGSGGLDSYDFNLDGSKYSGGSGGIDAWDSPTLPAGISNPGSTSSSGPTLLDQLGSTGSKILDSVLNGNPRNTGLIASLATGALKGYQDNRNFSKQMAANTAQSEEAYQRLLKMRAVPEVGQHGSAVDFGVKFKGGL